jgi:hypothetical protein
VTAVLQFFWPVKAFVSAADVAKAVTIVRQATVAATATEICAPSKVARRVALI